MVEPVRRCFQHRDAPPRRSLPYSHGLAIAAHRKSLALSRGGDLLPIAKKAQKDAPLVEAWRRTAGSRLDLWADAIRDPLSDIRNPYAATMNLRLQMSGKNMR
jgi:hypothetical protein